jgi:hypothetical protein
MYNMDIDGMDPNPDLDSLYDEYEEWLIENCKCSDKDEECTCQSYHDWFEEKATSIYECYSLSELEEMDAS